MKNLNRPIFSFPMCRKYYTLFLFLPFSFLTFGSPLQAQSGIEEAKKAYKDGDFENAIKHLESVIQDIAPTDSTNYIEAHKLMANAQYKSKDNKNAAKSFDQLLKYLPTSHESRGGLFYYMGVALLYESDIKGFTKANKNAAKAFGKTLGKNHKNYTKALNSLGYGQYLLAEYKNSEKTLRDAKKIKEQNKVFDIQYARIINQLGKTFTKLNNFQEAEENLLLSLKVKETVRKGKDNRDYAITQYNYAYLLQKIGRHEEALQQINNAIPKVSRKKDIIDFKQLKAGILVSMKRTDEAIKLYEELKVERQDIELKKTSDYAKLLYDLSDLYLEKEQLDQATKLIEEACTIFKEVDGEQHTYYAMAILQKANILLEKGTTSNLENLYKTSSKIIARRFSKRHIEYFKAEYSYFLFLKKTKKYSQAIDKIEKIDGIITDFIIDASKYLSIQEIIEVTDLYHEYFQEILSLTSLNPDNQVLTARAFDCSLFYKGYILETLLSIKKAIRHSKEITNLSEQLTELRFKLNTELDQTEKDNASIASIQSKISSLDIEMARRLGKLRDEDEKMSWDMLQYELADDEAIIDFVRFEDKEQSNHLYAAMIILRDAESPIFVSLFLESDITKYFKDKVTSSEDLIARLYQYNNRGLTPGKKLEEISLYDLIWKPIANHINDISKVYYICDGILHNIALHAIPTDLESVVSDKVNLLQMTSFRNLMRVNSAPYVDKIEKALLIGGVQYGTVPDTTQGKRSKRKYWGNLDWSEKEVDEIARLMKKKGRSHEVLKGATPKKITLREKLQDASQYTLLHFATHGYFATEDLLGVQTKVEVNEANIELTQSGLVLANANESEQKDAVMTAYEISELDLSNTELVVLSACETGLGKVYENEGVYGMQRAFKIAGAEYLIMSLWQVPDRETKVFMTEFYKRHLNEGLSIPEAFYETQKYMKNTLFDPVKWAGFVLLK